MISQNQTAPIPLCELSPYLYLFTYLLLHKYPEHIFPNKRKFYSHFTPPPNYNPLFFPFFICFQKTASTQGLPKKAIWAEREMTFSPVNWQLSKTVVSQTIPGGNLRWSGESNGAAAVLPIKPLQTKTLSEDAALLANGWLFLRYEMVVKNRQRRMKGIHPLLTGSGNKNLPIWTTDMWHYMTYVNLVSRAKGRMHLLLWCRHQLSS